mgnify:CR=1 FL=1
MRHLLVGLLLSAFCLPLSAAGPRSVAIKAPDGLVLKGSYHVAGGNKGRAVLLLHSMHSSRESWAALIEPLLHAGISVLAVDHRGEGETGGSINVEQSVGDSRQWLDWLRKQAGIHPDRVGIAGASIGADIGLLICAPDPQCTAAIALSPTRNFDPEQLDYTGRGLLVFASYPDRTSFLSAQAISVQAKGDVAVHFVEGNGYAHGIATLFDDERSRVPEFVNWLNYHL